MDEIETLFERLVEATNKSNSIPKPESESGDYEFYSTEPLFRQKMQASGSKILELLNAVIDGQAHPTVPPKTGHNSFSRPLKNPDDLADRFTEVVDVLDAILEKVVCFPFPFSFSFSFPFRIFLINFFFFFFPFLDSRMRHSTKTDAGRSQHRL